MITQIAVASGKASSPLSHSGKANNTDLTRQLPVRIVPGLQTPFTIPALLWSSLKRSVPSHRFPSLRSRGACARLLAETPRECCSSQQRRVSFPLLAPDKPSWQANGRQEVCMQKLKWEADTHATEQYRDTQAHLKKQSVPRTHAETTWHCLRLGSGCLGSLPSSHSLMGDFKRLAVIAYTCTQR